MHDHSAPTAFLHWSAAFASEDPECSNARPLAAEVEGVLDGGMRAEHALNDSPLVKSWARQGASEARGAHHSDRFVVCRPLDRGLGNDHLRRD